MPAYSSFAFIVFLITSTAFIIILFLPKIDFTCNVHFYLPFFIDTNFFKQIFYSQIIHMIFQISEIVL